MKGIEGEKRKRWGYLAMLSEGCQIEVNFWAVDVKKKRLFF